MSVKMSIQVIVILEQVKKNQLALIIVEFVLEFDNRILTLQNEFHQFRLNILNISRVFKCKVNHIRRIVNLLSFIQTIESL